jgi:hypothetical protein
MCNFIDAHRSNVPLSLTFLSEVTWVYSVSCEGSVMEDFIKLKLAINEYVKLSWCQVMKRVCKRNNLIMPYLHYFSLTILELTLQARQRTRWQKKNNLKNNFKNNTIWPKWTSHQIDCVLYQLITCGYNHWMCF